MLYFKKIRWMNFLSTGNQWTEIQLNRSPSTLIVGENGSGKSTMLDALSFGLYGKPYRNINKPLLINSITNKGCLVEIEFSIHKKEYLIRRGIKPNIFEIYCDNKLIDQSANIREYQEYLEKNILKLNHKSFTQIVVIGSANFTPFMQLKPYERRAVIEDLLDIEIFTKMVDLIRERVSKNRDSIRETKYQIDLLKQKKTMLMKHMNELNSLKKRNDENRNNQIREYEKKIDDTNLLIAEVNGEIAKLQPHVTKAEKFSLKLRKLESLDVQVRDRIDSIDREIQFYISNDDCPTCNRTLDNEFKLSNINDKKKRKAEISEGLNKLIDEYKKTLELYEEHNLHVTRISEMVSEIISYNAMIRSYMDTIEQLKTDESSNSIDVSKYNESLKEVERNHKQLESLHCQLIDEKEELEIANSLLRDSGIKARIIRQYIPIINKMMNKYLATLDFFVQFEIDENFNEKIKSRFRDEFCYDSFSEGEKMRIDMSLLFTWRAIAKLKNSVSTNLLVLDEVFDSSLDNTGTDEFLKMLTDLTKDTNVFVISHKGDALYDKFHSNIRFEKVKNFSRIAA